MSKISNITKGLEYLLAGFFLIGLSSCSISKHIPEGKYLVAKAGVDVKKISGSTERDRVREDLSAIMVQKPNRRFLGLLPIRMWFYLAAAKGKNNKFNQWVKSKLGEAPVVFDSLLATKSEMLMENYLWNEGYFENDVMFHTKIRRKKRLTVTFSVEPGQPWRIGNIIFPSGNSVGEAITRMRSGNTLLGSGMRFNIGVLKQERSRIETDLRNNGFVFFNKEFITFDLDTNRSSHTVNIYIKVNPPSDTTEHKPFRINKVFVFDNYDQSLSETSDLVEKTDTSYLREFIFIHTKEILKKKALREAIFFRQGELFTQDNFNRTMVRLNELGVFKFVSIDLQRSHRDSALINMLVFLTPSMKQTLSGGLNLNHNFEGLTGFGGNIGYRNRNLTRRADHLLIDAGINIQLNFSKFRNPDIPYKSFNTVDLTVDASYFLNRFLLPFQTKVFANTNPKTRINARYNYEIRRDFPSNYPLYNAHNVGVTYGYEWSARRWARHYYNPVFLNFYFINKEDSFINFLSRRPALKRSYDEQIITGGNYSITLTNQKDKYDRWYTFFKGTAEAAGNFLELFFITINGGYSPNRIFNILNRPFSQYVRIELDYRNYFRLNRHSLFAMRHYAGIGVPYANSRQLPYIKQFFVGGLNSLRGFQIREIGPGSYRDTTINVENPGANAASLFVDQTGDLKLEMNLEIRFDVYKWLKGAFFCDAGNIWLVRDDPTRPGGYFQWKNFIREFGVNIGAGARLDFSYFVIRLDYGVPIRDPRLDINNRWTIRRGQFNLAIGYPF